MLRVIDIHNNSLHIPMLFLKNLIAVFCHCAFQIRGERRRGEKGVFPLFRQSGRNGKLHRRRRKPQRGMPCPRPVHDNIAALQRNLGRARSDATQQAQEVRI